MSNLRVHYKTTTHPSSGVADDTGTTITTSSIGRPTPGYPVRVDVSTSSGQVCTTQFRADMEDEGGARAFSLAVDGIDNRKPPHNPRPPSCPQINDPDSDYASAPVQVAAAASNSAWSRLGLVAQLWLSHSGSLCRVYSTT